MRTAEPITKTKIDELVRSSLDQIKTMLTHAARGERFCNGYWGGLLKRRRVQTLPRRLVEVRGHAE